MIEYENEERAYSDGRQMLMLSPGGMRELLWIEEDERESKHTRDDMGGGWGKLPTLPNASPQPAKPFSEAYLERDSGDKGPERTPQRVFTVYVL